MYHEYGNSKAKWIVKETRLLGANAIQNESWGIVEATTTSVAECLYM